MYDKYFSMDDTYWEGAQAVACEGGVRGKIEIGQNPKDDRIGNVPIEPICEFLSQKRKMTPHLVGSEMEKRDRRVDSCSRWVDSCSRSDFWPKRTSSGSRDTSC